MAPVCKYLHNTFFRLPVSTFGKFYPWSEELLSRNRVWWSSKIQLLSHDHSRSVLCSASSNRNTWKHFNWPSYIDQLSHADCSKHVYSEPCYCWCRNACHRYGLIFYKSWICIFDSNDYTTEYNSNTQKRLYQFQSYLLKP